MILAVADEMMTSTPLPRLISFYHGILMMLSRSVEEVLIQARQEDERSGEEEWKNVQVVSIISTTPHQTQQINKIHPLPFYISGWTSLKTVPFSAITPVFNGPNQMLNCILGMVEKTQRAIRILQQRQTNPGTSNRTKEEVVADLQVIFIVSIMRRIFWLKKFL